MSSGSTALIALMSASALCFQMTSKAITCPLAWTPLSVRPAPITVTDCPVAVLMAVSTAA